MSGYAGFRISSLWAWTMIGDDDEEGLPTMIDDGVPMPMIASDRVRLDALRPLAAELARASGRPIRLRRFDFAEDVEAIEP